MFIHDKAETVTQKISIFALHPCLQWGSLAVSPCAVRIALIGFMALACYSGELIESARAQSKPEVTIAVLKHLDEYFTEPLDALYVDELSSLLAGDFELEIVEYRAGWSTEEVNSVIDEIYAEPEIDALLVLGFAANQRAIQRNTFTLPTFLPFVIESEIIGAPLADGASGKQNLNYLTYSTQFLDSIDILRDVVDFSSIAILVDETVVDALPDDLKQQYLQNYNGVFIDIVPHDGSDTPLIKLVPESAEAAIIGLLPRMSEANMQTLIDDLKARKIPTFSYLGKGLVERGVLSTAMNDSVYQLAARRNALNIQAVLLGENANAQPVMVESRPKLQINQKTAEEIGVSIDFKTLIGADVVGFGQGLDAQSYTLEAVVAQALQRNLQLQGQGITQQLQYQQLSEARSALRPQLVFDANHLERKDDSTLVQAGFAASESTDIALSMSQTLYSERRFANATIQALLAAASDQEYRQVQLDVVREAVLAMADVLQARAEAEINQENLEFSESNLELAVDRVCLGATSSADQYRWEAQVANARSAVFGAYSSLLIAQQNLNRVMAREVQLPIDVVDVNMDTLLVFSVQEIFTLMDNADTFEHLYRAGLESAYANSPELARLEQLSSAKDRELTALKRQRWLPEVELSGQLSDNIDSANAQMQDGHDWQVLVNAKIPLFQGGGLLAQQRTARLELQQLDNQREQIKLQLAQQLRRAMNNVLTSLFNLDFTQTAATSASKSLSLVTDSYNQGALSIVDLLDSQNTSISANLGAVQARVAFLRATVEMQRTMGDYHFLVSAEQRAKLRKDYQLDIADFRSGKSAANEPTSRDRRTQEPSANEEPSANR